MSKIEGFPQAETEQKIPIENIGETEVKRKAEQLRTRIDDLITLLGNGGLPKTDFVEKANALQEKMGDLNYSLNRMRRDLHKN